MDNWQICVFTRFLVFCSVFCSVDKWARLPRAMWGLVQHPGVLNVVENEEWLNLLSQQYSVHRGNLLQLVVLQQAPRDNRTICGDDWMRL